MSSSIAAEPKLVEPRALGLGPRELDPLECVAAPERKRLAVGLPGSAEASGRPLDPC